MTWFRVDDRLPTHRKVLLLRRGTRRLAALGAWTLCGAWASDNGTDGLVPLHVLDELGVTAAAKADLLACGLWLEVEAGVCFHDFTDWNPTAEKVAADRAATAERQKRWRERRNASEESASNASRNTVTNAAPTRPDPTHKEETPSVSPARKRARPRTGPPDDMLITPEMAAWGRENCPLVRDPKGETVRFLDHARANGKTFADWQAAWRTWMGNAQKYAARDGVRPAPAPEDESKAYLRESW